MESQGMEGGGHIKQGFVVSWPPVPPTVGRKDVRVSFSQKRVPSATLQLLQTRRRTSDSSILAKRHQPHPRLGQFQALATCRQA